MEAQWKENNSCSPSRNSKTATR